MSWKTRVAGLVLAAGMLGGAGMVAVAPAAATPTASCSSLGKYKLENNRGYEFLASCSGGAFVRSYIDCGSVEGGRTRTIQFPAGGQSTRWFMECSHSTVQGANIRLLNP
ncbi:hypothetical protein GCM10028784_31130 [Myceligenerans cantabricum]